MEDNSLIENLVRAIAGDTKAKREIAEEVARQDAEKAARLALEEAEAARLAEKRKHDKYELLPATREGKYGAFQQIRALRDFGDIHAGDLGGYVGSEANLDQKGAGWIYPGSLVIDCARVTEDAKIYTGCTVKDRAKVSGSAELYAAIMSDDSMVSGSAELRYCRISGGATITDQAKAQHAEIKGNACICEKVQIWGGGYNGTITIEGGRLAGEFAMKKGEACNLSTNGELPDVTEARHRQEFNRIQAEKAKERR